MAGETEGRDVPGDNRGGDEVAGLGCWLNIRVLGDFDTHAVKAGRYYSSDLH